MSRAEARSVDNRILNLTDCIRLDFVKNLAGGNNSEQGGAAGQQQGEGNFLDSMKNMANNAAGGGQAGEQKEDYLDKGVDFVQERMGQGDQSNENAIEQQKDEAISDGIRDQYKKMTGSDFPIADK
ncbi:hypothetical protein OIV83_003472 [Microbotryomycetes sp. JL201]|nr:hypothetical protein OIV83_003472 [Microbotryomycetes sp. JL201]